MTFEQLRAMNDGGTQRADFLVVASVGAGQGAVTVDFARYSLEAGSAVWIAPGAVHRWDDVADVSGQVALLLPTAPVTADARALLATPDLVAAWRIPEAGRPYVDAAWTHLMMETAEHVPHAVGDVRAPLVSVLLSRLDPPRSTALVTSPLFQAFQRSVEANFREHHNAEYYARTLGYAPRTVLRAVQQATGRTSKGYILDRLVLEAKRLLVHDGLSASTCAAALGFTDASNFAAAFRKAEGVSPGAWQRLATPG